MAALQIGVRHSGDVTVLDLWGQITIGETSQILRREIDQLINAGRMKILLHMGGVHQVDSSGLGCLVTTFTIVQNSGGKLKLVQLTEGLENLMIVTKLLTVFDIYETEKSALESFE